MRSFFVLLLLGIVLLTIALVVRSGMLARKHPGAPMSAAMREAMADDSYQLTARELDLIAQRYPGAQTSPTGLRSIIRSPGTGEATPKRGQLVSVHYTGRLLEGEKQFDSSIDRNEGPFNFHVGENRVIAGWDEALLAMHKGEKRTIIIPFWLAYGDKGIRGTIPSRASLVFDIELVDFK
ncbi:MAG: FKBP-type peptidyl-prolyl cis-trans isomerase [Opitutaceae bacterium]|jgi:FKBP-type peptidyl-prolyl cis-trans isomerase